MDIQQDNLSTHGNLPLSSPLPGTTHRKKATRVRYLWIPVALVILGLIGWVVLTLTKQPLGVPNPLRTMAASAALTHITPTTPALSAAAVQTLTACNSLPVCKQEEIKPNTGWLSFDTSIQKGEHVRIIYFSGKRVAQPGADMSPHDPGSGGSYIPQAGSNALVAKIGDYSTRSWLD